MSFAHSIEPHNRRSTDRLPDSLNTNDSLDSYPHPTYLPPLHFAVVLPTYNERDNIPLVIARLTQALQGIEWEAIFVDDDSPDGTAQVVAAYARSNPEIGRRIRLIHRIGQRGLASACIDGMMATLAPVVAVMDADLQHDESILPTMLRRLQSEQLDVVVATRNAEGGSMGGFGRQRVLLSRVGQKIGNAVCQCSITDPMSGFFMVRRSFLLEVVPHLQRGGFKILVDLLASSKNPVAIGEVGYTFGVRRYGTSKLDVFVGIEYLALIFSKLLGGLLPARTGLFLLVGGLGVVAHLCILAALMLFGHAFFVSAQITATFIAMAGNFYFNNIITFRDSRLRGSRIFSGAARFTAACSIAAWANVVTARALWQSGTPWLMAGLTGIVLGSVWNLSVSSHVTWGLHRAEPDEDAENAIEQTMPVAEIN